MFEGRGFESQNRSLDGHYFTYICYRNINVTKKEARDGPFKKTIFVYRISA